MKQPYFRSLITSRMPSIIAIISNEMFMIEKPKEIHLTAWERDV